MKTVLHRITLFICIRKDRYVSATELLNNARQREGLSGYQHFT